jgi:hypothetical protein
VLTKVQIEGMEEREATVRKYASMAELLGTALQGQTVEDGEIFKMAEGRLKPIEKAVFKFVVQKPLAKAQVCFACETWDERSLRIEFEIARGATLASIWPEIQARAGERLDDVGHYVTMKGNSFARLPWEHRQKYELTPAHALAATIICTNFPGTFSVKVPKFSQAIGQPIASIWETGNPG